MGLRFEKEYEVHYYEVDAKLDCTIRAIVDFLCDIGTKQSEELGVGIDFLTERNLAWVFYKYDINVRKYPKYGEVLRIITEPRSFKKFFASRVYEIYNSEDEKIIDGEAVFLLIDTNKRRAVRVPDELTETYGVEIEKQKDINITKLEKLTDEMYTKRFQVRYSDIDSNNHVNNVKYLEWALEVVPVDLFEKYSISNISITFDKECSYGHIIKASCQVREDEDNSLTILHKIEDEDGKNLTTVVTKWR